MTGKGLEVFPVGISASTCWINGGSFQDSGAGGSGSPLSRPLGKMTLRFWKSGQQDMLHFDWWRVDILGSSRTELVPALLSGSWSLLKLPSSNISTLQQSRRFHQHHTIRGHLHNCTNKNTNKMPPVRPEYSGTHSLTNASPATPNSSLGADCFGT